MKREHIEAQLKSAGVTDETQLKSAVDAIMAENGKDVTAVKEQLTTAQATISTLQETVKQFDGVDLEGLRTQVNALQTESAEKIAQLHLTHAVELALRDAHAKNPKLAQAALDLSAVKVDENGKVTGLKEQLEALQTSDAYLFETTGNGESGASGSRVNTGGNHTGDGGSDAPKTLRGALTEHYSAGG